MISGMRLRWRGSRCCTTTTVAPNPAGKTPRTDVNAVSPPADAAMAMISNGALVTPGRSGARSSGNAALACKLARAHVPEVPPLLEARELDLEQDEVGFLHRPRRFEFRFLDELIGTLEQLALEADQPLVCGRPALSLFQRRGRRVLAVQAVILVAQAAEELFRQRELIAHRPSSTAFPHTAHRSGGYGDREPEPSQPFT